MRVIKKNIESIQPYSFKQTRFYGLWCSQGTPPVWEFSSWIFHYSIIVDLYQMPTSDYQTEIFSLKIFNSQAPVKPELGTQPAFQLLRFNVKNRNNHFSKHFMVSKVDFENLTISVKNESNHILSSFSTNYRLIFLLFLLY